MRKLISLLSAIITTGTFATNVVSCKSGADNSRISDPSLSQKILDQINISAKDYSELSSLTTKDIWKSNSSTINTLVYNLLQKNVALDYYIKTMVARSDNLNLTPNTKTLTEYFSKYITNLAENQLYETYSKDFTSKNYFENQIFKQGYSPDIQSLDWNYGGFSPFWYAQSGKAQNWNNGSPESFNKVTDIPDTPNFSYWTDSLKDNVSEAKKELAMRFQTYLTQYLEPQLFKTVLINSFLQSGSFQWDSENKRSEVSQYSPLFNVWQSWTNNNWESNMKMVWEVRFTKPDKILSDEQWSPFLANLVQVKNWSDFEKALKGFSDAKNYGLTYGGTQQLGSDPIFGKPGYEGLFGITPNSSDPTQAGTIFTQDTAQSTDITSYKTPLTNDSTFQPGIIRNSNMVINGIGDAPYFQESNGDITIAFALPIYFSDLVKNISYTPYESIKDGKINNPISSFNTTNQNLSDEWKKMNANPGENRSSSDVANLSIVGDDNQAEDLFNLIESAIATNGTSSSGDDTSVALYAQQALYSWAFDGDVNNIYSSDLYDKIGKYIEKHE